MAHVSKLALSPNISIKIKKNFLRIATKNRGLILDSLLTPTESLMLAKRLSMIVLLLEGTSAYGISKDLKVSVSTVQRFESMISSGLFKPISRNVNKSNRSIADIIELVLAAGMPSIAGPRATQRLNRLRRGDPAK